MQDRREKDMTDDKKEENTENTDSSERLKPTKVNKGENTKKRQSSH